LILIGTEIQRYGLADKDGRRTQGLAINKTNWANPLDTPPFHAYHVTTGVTFTFDGLKISRKGEVEDLYGRIIPGLYAAGEIVGGLFFHNYASGTGLMSGGSRRSVQPLGFSPA
jgi:tricarballylate dehydrogenase